jgi:hypothetical protein
MVVVRFFISIFLQYFTIYAVLSAFDIYVVFIMALLPVYLRFVVIAVWPPFLFKGRCPFCSPKIEKKKLMPLNLLFSLAITFILQLILEDDNNTNNGLRSIDFDITESSTRCTYSGETEGYTWGLLAGSIIQTYFSAAVEPKYVILGQKAEQHR